jgi:gliding motility-associated protein GldC
LSKNTSTIAFEITTDENHVPEKITWEASAEQTKSTAKATLVSIWDEKEENTLRIDLWNKDMTTDEMKRFFHQSLLTMADTFERATNEAEMAEDLRHFSHYFAEKMKLVETEEKK